MLGGCARAGVFASLGFQESPDSAQAGISFFLSFFLSLPVPGHSQFEYHSVSCLQKYGHMLVYCVNSRRHSPRLHRPCRGASRGPSSLLALSRLQELLLYIHPSPITHLQSTLPQVFILENLKPFRCSTYEKQGEG